MSPLLKFSTKKMTKSKAAFKWYEKSAINFVGQQSNIFKTQMFFASFVVSSFSFFFYQLFCFPFFFETFKWMKSVERVSFFTVVEKKEAKYNFRWHGNFKINFCRCAWRTLAGCSVYFVALFLFLLTTKSNILIFR